MANILITLALPDRTGASKMALQFIAKMAKEGHRVVLAHGGIQEDISYLPEIRQTGAKTVLMPALERTLNWAAVSGLCALARQEKPQVVIGFNQKDRANALLAGKMYGAKTIVSAQNQHKFYGSAFSSKIKKAIYAFIMRNLADHICCTSPVVKDEMRAFGIDDSKLEILPNGIDAINFPVFEEKEKLAVRRSLGIEDDEVLIMNVGRIDPQKGMEHLLEAFALAKTPKARLLIVGGIGEGEAKTRGQAYMEKLQGIVAQHNLHKSVIFAGLRKDVPLLLASSQIYCHAALWEGLSLATIESMAASLPTIITDCSGPMTGFVDGIHGYMVPKGNTQALANALGSLLALSPASLQEMGAKAKHLAVSFYDIELISSKFEKAVRNLT